MVMNDTNNNGKVNQVVAVFSEALLTTTAVANWTLTNVPSGGTLAHRGALLDHHDGDTDHHGGHRHRRHRRRGLQDRARSFGDRRS